MAGAAAHRAALWPIAGNAVTKVQAFAAARENLVALDELPAISWNRLAIEMRANIRLGLAAGECVRDGRTAGLLTPFGMLSNLRALTACASVMVLVAVGLLLQRPAPIAATAATVAAGEGSRYGPLPNGIELNQGGETLSLLHVRTENAVFSAGAQGSMRAGYVDADTGNVTINNLYVQ